MKRNLLILMASSGIALSAQGAIPITSYESTAVEIPADYAVQGGYWGLALGFNHIGNNSMGAEQVIDPSTDNVIPLPDLVIESSPGYSFQLSTGYRIYRWRFEAELGYRTNKAKIVRDITYDVSPAILTLDEEVAATGNTSVISLMANIMYDRYYQSGWMWMIGGGVGGARINYDVGIDIGTTFTPAQLAFVGTSQLLFNKKSIVPAFQAILGIGYTWSEHIETAVTYRYFYPLNSTYWAENTFISGAIIEFNPQYRAHLINLEIRFT